MIREFDDKEKKMKKVVKRISLVAVVIAVIVIAALLPKGKSEFGPKPNNSMNEEKIHSVKSMIIEKTNLTEYLTMNGNIQPINTISVYPNIGGKITKVLVTLGSTVKRGEKIAEVDPSTPGSYYDASPVYAPISGSITALPLTVGTSVSTSTSIAQIGNIDTLQIKANVPERDIAVLKNGLKADVVLTAYKNETLKAHIIRVSPIVDEVSRSKEIYFAFDKEDSRVNAGMYAKIKLYTTEHKNIIAIPFDSVRTIDEKYFVYVINTDSSVAETEITLGVNVDGIVQVLSGLSEGQKIVVSANQSLTNGAKVKEI